MARFQNIPSKNVAKSGADDDEADGHALASLPIGRRNARLLALRESVFGGSMEGLADCPDCGARLEMTLPASDLREGEGPAEAECAWGAFACRFRPPNSYDLADALKAPDPERRLLGRCVVEARGDGAATSWDDLPPAMLAEVERLMAEADPLAVVRLDLTCPDCGHRWAEPFDVASYFWAELDAWGVRLLHDVHAIASAYGWSESAILGMHPWRRRLYLEILGR